MNTRKRFRAQLAVLEAKQAARMAQRREGEKKQKAQERIEELRRKPEEELTPEERDLTRVLIEEDPLYPAILAWERALKREEEKGIKEDEQRRESMRGRTQIIRQTKLENEAAIDEIIREFANQRHSRT